MVNPELQTEAKTMVLCEKDTTPTLISGLNC
jgi:hypothetical protein